MDNLVIDGSVIMGLIYVLVNQAKRVGLRDKWAGLLALGLGVGFMAIHVGADLWPPMRYVEYVLIAGLVAGAGAMGMWASNPAKSKG